MITLQSCLDTISVESSTIHFLNKLIFNPKKCFTSSDNKETYWDFGIRLDDTVRHVSRQLRYGKYNFKPYLHIQRRLKPQKLRDIYIASWEDKIVERWMSEALNKSLNWWFSKHSYAYRIDELGIDECQQDIAKSIRKNNFIIKRDISNFFYTIDHDILLKKLSALVEPADPIFDLIKRRIQFEYTDGKSVATSKLGLPFGSPIACVLSNIYLTELDRVLSALPVDYYRYADDFIIMAKTPESALEAAKIFDDTMVALKLKTKPSHCLNISFIDHPSFTKIDRFRHLGLEFTKEGVVRLSVDKQRKVLNFFNRALNASKAKIRRERDLTAKVMAAVEVINSVIEDRVRSIAIIDYYLKHVTDETQLKMMDRLIAESVISCVLNKKFRNRDFQTIPYKMLRDAHLVSLVHRHRLFKHGHLKISFMSMRNDLLIKRRIQSFEKRADRINQIRLWRKLKGPVSNTNEQLRNNAMRLPT
jgi:hypothetical protein